MKRIFKRGLCLTLVLLMLLSLAACGKKDGGSENGGNNGGSKNDGSAQTGDDLSKAQKVRLENVYVSTPLNVKLESSNTGDGSNYSEEYLNNIAELDGKLAMSVSYYKNWTEKDAYGNDTYQYESGCRLYMVDMVTGEKTVAFDFENENESTDTTYSGSSVENLYPMADGTLWYVSNEYFEDYSDPENYNYTNNNRLVHAAADGSELFSVDVKELFGAGEEEYVYIDRFLPMADGSLVLTYSSGVAVLTADGQMKGRIDIPGLDNGYVNNFYQTGSGKLFLQVEIWNDATGENTDTTYQLDTAALKADPVADDLFRNLDGYWNFREAPGDCFYLYSNNGISLYDLNSKTITPVLNWINSDINYQRVDNYVPLSDSRFVITEHNKDWTQTTLSLLTPAAEGDIVEKYVITLASVYQNSDLVENVINYNKRNAEYRITINDYSIYNTEETEWNGGVDQLNLDLIAGKVPDILVVGELPIDNYISKGMLLDLGQMMDSDESFNRADYLENVLNITEKDGKLYSLIPYFSVMTVAGKAENVGSDMGWTMDELQQLMQRYPDASLFEQMSRSSFLQYVCGISMNNYVNYETGECRFNSEDFIKLLELVKTFPEEIDWDAVYEDAGEEYWSQQETQYAENRTLLYQQYLSAFTDLRYTMYQFRTEDVTLVGFPVSEGMGTALTPGCEFAISAKTPLKNACWSFLKDMLSEDMQDALQYQFPIRLSSLEKLKEQAMTDSNEGYDIAVTNDAVIEEAAADTEETAEVTTEVTLDDPFEESEEAEGDIVAEEPAVIAPADDYDVYDKFMRGPMTEAQVQKVMDVITGVRYVYRDQSELLKIIEEEAEAFFAGQKDAKSVADVIQSRAWIYISENS